MQFLNTFLNSFGSDQSLIMAIIFVAAVVFALVVAVAIMPVIETRRRLRDIEPGARPTAPGSPRGDINAELQLFYETFLKGDRDSSRMRLIQAGYFSPSAITVYNVIRFVAAIVLFVGTYYFVVRFTATATTLTASLFAAIVGSFGLVLPSFVLEKVIKDRRERYRQLFPDFVDMMVVCADAGLSIEAAANRVARDYLVRDRAFGIHLGVMMLEVRAGKRLREAMYAMADRIGVEEAKSLATLFKQSEELGVSLTKALRTHSKEMRQMRILRAEEKANVLPIKMLMPMGAFIFPVTLVIVLVPIMIKLIETLRLMTPEI